MKNIKYFFLINKTEKKTRIKMFIFKCIILLLFKLKAFVLISKILKNFTKKLVSKNKQTNFINLKKKVNILVLDQVRFRGDLEVLAAEKNFQIITISWTILLYLLSTFVRHPTSYEKKNLTKSIFGIRWDFRLASSNSTLFQQRQNYRIFLKYVLPLFLKSLNIDLILNSDFRYRREADFVKVASEIGYPHICFYREAMHMSPAIYKVASERNKIMGKFYGKAILVQNKVTKDMLISSGIVNKEKIFIRGLPRMDYFLKSIKTHKNYVKSKQLKIITYFSSPIDIPISENGFIHDPNNIKPNKLFDFSDTIMKTFEALVEIAQKNKDIKIIIKLKDQHAKNKSNISHLNFLNQAIKKYSAGAKITNIEVESEKSSIDILKISDVVCGMQSTTLMEAALMKKPVILTHFDSLINQHSSDEALIYYKSQKMFFIPRNKNEFNKIVLNKLANPFVTKKMYNLQKKYFNEHISFLDASASKKTLKLINAFTK